MLNKLLISKTTTMVLMLAQISKLRKISKSTLTLFNRVLLSFFLSFTTVTPGNAQQIGLLHRDSDQEPQHTLQLNQQAISQISGLMNEKENRSPAQQKIGSQLLHAKRLRERTPMANGLAQIPSRVEVQDDGRTLVDIKSEVSDSLLSQIETLGGEIVNSFSEYDAIRARIPLDRIEEIATIPQIRSIVSASEPMTNALNPNANTVSQGDIAHRTAQSRNQFKVEGKGVSVGVISDSVDSLTARQASGDLPSKVTVLATSPGTTINPRDEGTAMLEIVHDIAPRANLLYATGFGGEAAFASRIRALAAAGANIIVDDLTYFTEPVFEDGIIAEAVNEVVSKGVTYFSSAANSGNLNAGQSGVWEGNFAPTAAPSVVPGSGVVAHDFGGGANSNLITQDPPQLITLQWSDPWGGSSNDYDLYVLDQTLTSVVAFSNNTQNGSQDPYEQINSGIDASGNPINHLNNRIVVVRTSGQGRYIHVNTHRGRLAIGTDGSTFGHNAAESAITVAAVDVATANGGAFTGGAANPVQTFSSDGPRRIFYHADGTPITPRNFSSTGGTNLQKPDIAAGDCVATDALPQNFFNPFCGTSAAAPHAAAIAALMKAQNSSLTPEQIRQALESAALDIEATGVDRDSGYGLIDAQRALAAVSVKYAKRLMPNGEVFLNGEDLEDGKLSYSWLAAPGARWYRVTVRSGFGGYDDTLVWEDNFTPMRLGCEHGGTCRITAPISHKPGERYTWWVTTSLPTSVGETFQWKEYGSSTTMYKVSGPPVVTEPPPKSYVHDQTQFVAQSANSAVKHTIWLGVKEGNSWKPLGSEYYAVGRNFSLPDDHQLQEGQIFELWYYTFFDGERRVASQQRYTFTKHKLLDPLPLSTVDDSTIFKGAHPNDAVRHGVWIGRNVGGHWQSLGNPKQPYMPAAPHFRLPDGHQLQPGDAFELWYYTDFKDGHKEVDHQTYYYKKKVGLK